MGLAIAVVLTLITAVSVSLISAHFWWFPVDVATHGPAIDHLFTLTFIFTGAIFVLAQLGLAYLIWRYRDRGQGGKATYLHEPAMLQVTWTLIALILFVGLAFMGHRTWAHMHYTGAQPGALRIEVWGEQFAWYFRYPGPDGRFGPIHPSLMDDSMGNYLGLDRPHDQASKDDIVTATLGIPADRPVQLILRSKDVIHSFFVPELRMKQDLVPGMEMPIHFTATEDALNHDGGRYEIVCTQLCGMGHYKMRAFLQVMTEKKFEQWLKQEAAMQ
ncbi:MAG TPA: cytochrome C oxidase subunit II [Terriglobia bacterium]|nr:cytochrome C oxidase subunit II [Terriglobia bacterium]